MSPWPSKKPISVIAAYNGKCPECGEQITEGDEIFKTEDDFWVCINCTEDWS